MNFSASLLKGSYMKNKFVLLIMTFAFSCSCLSVFAQEKSSASLANRRTAVRYLKLAKQYAGRQQWNEADSQAVLGLEYDDSVSDLWYIRAVSSKALGGERFEALPFIEKSLEKNNWVDYNRDGARILYADLLSSTLRFEQAIEMLDEKPLLYSADAEYIRIKCYYNLEGDENLEKARAKIDAARRVYPNDSRFADLFYKYEYKFQFGKKTELSLSEMALNTDEQSVSENSEEGERKNPENQDKILSEIKIDENVKKIAGNFSLLVPKYKNPVNADEIEMFDAIFSDGEDQIRKIKAFYARGGKSPYFAVFALKLGIIDAVTALDSFYEFAGNKIDFAIMEEFVQLENLLADEKCKKELCEYLNSYEGIITFDTDGDLEHNVEVKYHRGRPESIIYDWNQDGKIDWQAICDFGLPKNIKLGSEIDVDYDEWPYASKISTENSVFNLIPKTLSWSPVDIIADETVKKSLGVDFYIPVCAEKEASDAIHEIRELNGNEEIKSLKYVFNKKNLLKYISSMEIPITERADSHVQYLIQDGNIISARYFEKDYMYSVVDYKDGLPNLRLLDSDNDGVYETTIEYAPNPNPKKEDMDSFPLRTLEYEKSEVYEKLIQIDRDGDTIPDYSEFVNENFDKICSWDGDGDGKWEMQYVKFAMRGDQILREASSFIKPIFNTIVTVSFENENPVKVTDDGRVISVTKGFHDGFYWLDEICGKSNEELILKSVNLKSNQGMATIVNSRENSDRFFAIRIGKMIFGEKLPASLTNIKEEK